MPRNTALPAPFALAAALLALPAAAAAQDATDSPVRFPASHHGIVVTPVADGLIHPWGMAFLPDGDLLVTERPGRLRIVRDGRVLPEPVAGVPEVFAEGQGGLLDVALHPDFETNRLVYLSYSKPLGDEASTTAVVRGRLVDGRLVGVEEIFEADTRGRGHYGSRLVFDGEGHLFISLGDRQVPPQGDLEAHPAQDLSDHHGTIVRLMDDGTVPSDNPFVGREGVHPGIWSYGHRNVQGMAVHPVTGDVWATEHGPQGGDELNLIRPGLNYGWPVIGYGVNYRTGTAIHEGTHREGMEQPEHVWVPSIATSGLIVYTGDAFPGWRGDLLTGGLAGEVLQRLRMDGQDVVLEETLVHDIGRVRDVEQGPDGNLYLAIDARGGEPAWILRVEPAGH